MSDATLHPVRIEPVEAAEATSGELLQQLKDFSETHAGLRNSHNFTLSVRDNEGQLIGGLTGEVFWNSLYVAILWVRASSRGQGYGSALMREAEAIARSRSCDVAFLGTMTFQAPEFYRKCGYVPFAELRDTPKGFSRIWMKKRLTEDL